MDEGSSFGAPTTNVVPTYVNVTVALPDELEWRAIVLGAISLMTETNYWQQLDPTHQTPKEASQIGQEILKRMIEDYQE